MINVVLILGISDINLLNKRLDRAIEQYKSFEQDFTRKKEINKTFTL